SGSGTPVPGGHWPPCGAIPTTSSPRRSPRTAGPSPPPAAISRSSSGRSTGCPAPPRGGRLPSGAEAEPDGMPNHLWITCPHCRRSNLRLRPENIGKRVVCKLCHRSFVAQEVQEASPAARPTLPREATAGEPPGQGVGPEAEVERPRDEPGTRPDDQG